MPAQSLRIEFAGIDGHGQARGLFPIETQGQRDGHEGPLRLQPRHPRRPLSHAQRAHRRPQARIPHRAPRRAGPGKQDGEPGREHESAERGNLARTLGMCGRCQWVRS